MKTAIDAVTLAKIGAFGRRRRRMIFVRGLCAAVATLLVAMSAAAIVDYLVLLSDEVRWALSGAAYAAAAAAAWITCGRFLLRSPDPRRLARLIESAEPGLREDLLSAVELGTPPAEEGLDSPEFRALLQRSVAGRMEGLQVGALLPWRRIRGWLRAAAGVLAACVALLVVPGLHYAHLLARSLLPIANLERVSLVQVEILEPDPPGREVPQGDSVAVRIRVAGAGVEGATLETFQAGRRERASMKPGKPGEFTAVLAVAREPVAYRIRAGDAVTRRYLLVTRPRPEVARFRKTYRYPEYTRRAEPRVAVEEGGDLAELEGTVCDLELEVNQDIRAGELRLELGGKPSVMRLEPAGLRSLKATVPLSASGTYRVHLVAAATGFENKFSPQYAVKAHPDLVPSVTLAEPARDLMLPPDDIVELRGTAKDDLGLVRILQVFRVNQEEWKETVLAESPKENPAAVARRWDLLELRAQPGDRVTVKLAAVDLKGSRAESAPVHLAITSPRFDPERLVPLAAKEAAYDALVQLRDAIRAIERRVREAAGIPGAAGELQRRQSLAGLASELEKVVRQAGHAEARLKEALRLARAGREAADLALVGRAVLRIREGAVPSARAEIERASAMDEAAAAAPVLKRAEGLFDGAADLAGEAEQGYREILALEEALAIAGDLDDLASEQAALGPRPKDGDAKGWERVARRQGVAASQVKGVEDLLALLARRAPEGWAPRADQIRKGLEARRAEFERTAAAPPGLPAEALAKAGTALAGPSEALRREIEGARTALLAFERDLAARAHAAREALERRVAPSWAEVQGLRREARSLAEAEKQGRGREQGDRTVERWAAARAQLEGRAGLEESRRDQDPFFVADASLAARALEATLGPFAAGRDAAAAQEPLQTVEQAFRTLESGHALAELSAALGALAQGERWKGTKDPGRRGPRDGEWVLSRPKATADDLKGAGLAAEALKAWAGADAERVRREMAERVGGRPAASIGEPLERLSAETAKAVRQVQPMMEEARRALARLVPALAARLAALADAAESIRKGTSDLAERAPRPAPEQVRQESRGLLDRQRGLDAQIDAAAAALRRDANVQDLLDPEGRERARDADDAVAMLRETPPKAEDFLAEAAAAAPPAAQERALARAAEQQGKIADALRLLAEHYKGLEAGKGKETRPALRAAEEALGLKPALDDEYGRLEKLAGLPNLPPDEARQELEEMIAGNEAMKRSLEELARNALDRAESKLAQAADQERRVAEGLQKAAAQEAQKSSTLAGQAKKLAEAARRLAREEIPAAAKAAPAEAAGAFDQARRNLEAGAGHLPSDAAAQEFQQAAKDLQGAAQKAAEAAQSARQAADREGAQAEAAQQASRRAAQAAQAAQQVAAEKPGDAAAQQAAREAASKAQSAQEAAQREAREAQAAREASGRAQAAEQGAGQSASKANDLAQQAKQLAESPRGAEVASLRQAAAQQEQVGQALREAAAAAEQAARHEARLGQAVPAQSLERSAQGIRSAAQGEVPAAARALGEAKSAGQAQPAVAAAQKAIQAQQAALSQARDAAAPRGQPGAEAPADPAGAAPSEAASDLLAQALDALDRSQGQPGPPSPSASQAMAAAAQAQAAGMRAARSQGEGQGQGQSSSDAPGSSASSASRGLGKGALAEAGARAAGTLPDAPRLRGGEWGKLPPRLARDLMEAQKESLSGEYRGMIETYFRVVAERARESRK